MNISTKASRSKEYEILTANYTLRELEKDIDKELALALLMVDKERIDSFLKRLSISSLIIKNLDVKHKLGLKERVVALVNKATELAVYLD